MTQCVTRRPSKTMPNVLFKGSGAVKHVNWQSFAKAVDGGQTTKFFPKQNWSLYRKSLSDGKARELLLGETHNEIYHQQRKLLQCAPNEAKTGSNCSTSSLSKATPFNKQVHSMYLASFTLVCPMLFFCKMMSLVVHIK